MHQRPGNLPQSAYDSGTNFTLTPVSEEGSKMIRTRVFATLGVAGVMCASFAGVASAAQAAPPSSVNCVVSAGVTQTATKVTGTGGDDTIDCTGASQGKTINGLDGNDTITGTAFNDTINGGNGNDSITGGAGNDTINGGNGNDTVTGGAGNDRIEGGNGNDTLTGSAGNDTVTDTGDGEDTITP
jgi:hemolysin type calcium-binding protein